MINSVSAKGFSAVPYLEASLLMQNHPTLHLSGEKPNAIYGANGTGKSALLKALALHTMSFYFGQKLFRSELHLRDGCR